MTVPSRACALNNIGCHSIKAINAKITVEEIDSWLPQTQCTACGYPRCLDYAAAISKNETGINRCPPGDEVTIAGLTALLELPITELDPEVGPHQPRQTYYIDESRCIGCTLCIKACPVDAIIGTGKLMHSIIESECTGCDLCVPPCPMDCILSKACDLQPATNNRWQEYSTNETEKFRARINQRLTRLAKNIAQQQNQQPDPDLDSAQIKSEIKDALKRVQERKAALKNNKKNQHNN